MQSRITKAIAVLILATGCAAADTEFACEFGSSADQATHSCSDFVYTNMPPDLFETAKTQCAAFATVLDACDTTGATGGCTNTVTTNDITTVTTTWQYAGDAATVEALCAQLDDYTFVAP